MADNNRDMIEKLEGEWRDALCNKDIDRLRAMMHPDFELIGTRATGPFIMRRDQWLEAIQHRDVESVEVEVHDATALDKVLVGTVLAKWRVRYLGRVIEDCVLSTDVWARDDDRWLALRRHSTPAPAGTCPEELGEQ